MTAGRQTPVHRRGWWWTAIGGTEGCAPLFFSHQQIQTAHFPAQPVGFVYSSPRCAHISPSDPVDRSELFTQLSWPPSFGGRRVEVDGWQPAAVLITPRNNFWSPKGASSSFSLLFLWREKRSALSHSKKKFEKLMMS